MNLAADREVAARWHMACAVSASHSIRYAGFIVPDRRPLHDHYSHIVACLNAPTDPAGACWCGHLCEPAGVDYTRHVSAKDQLPTLMHSMLAATSGWAVKALVKLTSHSCPIAGEGLMALSGIDRADLLLPAALRRAELQL